jgi:hypothetical protein
MSSRAFTLASFVLKPRVDINTKNARVRAWLAWWSKLLSVFFTLTMCLAAANSRV